MHNLNRTDKMPAMSYVPFVPPPKKYTEFIFTDLKNSKDGGSFGYLSLMFEIFKDLARHREEKGWSQNDLSKHCGIPQSNIARIESGRTNPTLYQLIKLTKALGVKIKFEPAKYDNGDYEGYME